MSATGRGIRMGGPDDVYETPTEAVTALLRAWRPRVGDILDPCAGTGAIALAANGLCPGNRWHAVEARATCDARLLQLGVYQSVTIADYLSWTPPDSLRRDMTAVIANPPYSQAEAFIRRSRELFPQAAIAMLLRLGFLAGQKRAAFYRDMGQPDVYVLAKRPSFTGGGTDSADYCWAIWPGYQRTGLIYRLEAAE